jgi:hypothetical protein
MLRRPSVAILDRRAEIPNMQVPLFGPIYDLVARRR